MDRKKFAFDKTNFLLLGIGMLVVIVGFLLMSGPSSTMTHFELDIFSVRRVKVAPVVCLLGFVKVAPVVCLLGFLFMIYAVLRKPKENKEEKINE